MEKKLTKKEKGITLVALIITIIVLLILAVVSIRAITGDNILGKTESAKGKYSEGEEEEKVKLAVQEAAIDGIGTIEKTHLEIAVDNQFKPKITSVNELSDNFLVTIEESGNEYLVSKEGNVTKKAPSNIKYVFGQEGVNDNYIVILKNNNVFYALEGQKIPIGTYSEGTKISEMDYYKDYTIYDNIKDLDKFIVNDDGKILLAINKEGTWTIDQLTYGSDNYDGKIGYIRLRENTTEPISNVDLSGYEF